MLKWYNLIDFIEQIDQQLFLAINGLHNTFFDKVMWAISDKYTWLPLYALLLFLILKKEGVKAWLVLIFIGLLITLSDQLSVHLFKEVFQRYRPCHNMELKDHVHLVYNHCGGLYSFVSSHATNFFALALFLSLYFKKRWVTILLWVVAFTVSYSRIYLGVHYPADILIGGLFGSLIAIIFSKLFFFFRRRLALRHNIYNHY